MCLEMHEDFKVCRSRGYYVRVSRIIDLSKNSHRRFNTAIRVSEFTTSLWDSSLKTTKIKYRKKLIATFS